MAFPALTPITAAILAAPVQGGPAVAAIVAAGEVWYLRRRGRALDGPPAAEPPTTPDPPLRPQERGTDRERSPPRRRHAASTGRRHLVPGTHRDLRTTPTPMVTTEGPGPTVAG